MNKHLLKAAVLAAVTMAGLPSHAIDLVGSYRQAQQNDPTLRAADEALAAGREKSVQGRALTKAQVGLGVGVARLDNHSSASVPAPLASLLPADSSGTAHQVALQLTKPLWDQKAKADGRQLQQQSVLAEIQHRDAGADLVKRVGETYFELLLAQENLRVARAEKAAVALQRDRAQARFEVGRGKVTEVQEAQARYDGVLAREVAAQSRLALNEAQYQELTGVMANGLAGLRQTFVAAPPQPDDLAAWQARALAANPRVQSKHSELAIAGFEIAKYKLSGRPTLDLVASYTMKGQSGSLSSVIAPDGNRAASIGVQLNVPLYAGGGLDSRERESLAKKRQAEQSLVAAQRDARLQVQDAFLAVKSGVARVAAVEQSVRSAQTALEATTLGRDLGTRTELDVLDAQQRLFSAQLDLAQSRHDYLMGRIRLANAAGELQEADLVALNQHLQP